MSRFAAAPISRLRGLLRGGPADVAPVATDTAPAAPDVTIIPDAPVARDDAPAAVELSADIAPEIVVEVAATVISEPEIAEPAGAELESFEAASTEAASTELANTEPASTEPASIEDMPVAHIESPVIPEEPVALEVASEAAEAVADVPVVLDAETEIPDEQADAEPAAAEVVELTPDAPLVLEIEAAREDATPDTPIETAAEISAEIVIAEEPAVVEAIATDALPAPEEAPLILDSLVVVDQPSEAPVALVEEISVVSTEAAPEAEPEVAVEPPPPPAKPEQPPAKPAVVEDRPTLIRRRWTETGIRMWNPRLHGTGEATLSIQGQVALLPPEPGETLPRYDRLEFKLLGGQIVCEGVILDAPVHASRRNFTQLADRQPERPREMPAERQAVLA